MSYLYSNANAVALILPLVWLCSLTPAFGQSDPNARGRVGPEQEMPLLDGAQCTYNTSRSTYDRLSTGSSLVAVNRRPYESQFFMPIRATYEAALTCLADSSTFPLLVLQMGVPDEDAARDSLATVNVYQSGNIIHSYDNIVPGSLINTTLILGNGEDFSVELICHRSGPGGKSSNCNLHFLEAKLHTGGGSSTHSSPSTSGAVLRGDTVSTSEEPTNNPTATDSERSEGHTRPNDSGDVVEDAGTVLDDIEKFENTIERILDLL